jgi:hypothetical protein
MDTGLGSHLRTHSTSTLVDPLTVWDFVSHLLGHPFPPGNSAPLTVGLPSRPTTYGDETDPGGVSMFRTWETQLGLGVLCTPGTAVFTRP